MAINLSLLEAASQATIDNLSPSSKVEDILLVGWEASNVKLTLSSVNFLPDLNLNTYIPDGYIVYCEDINACVMAVGNRWRLMNGVDVLPVTQGTLWTWGLTTSSPVTVVGGGTTWNQVSVGFGSNAAIKTDGTLWTWGVNNFGQLGDGTTTSRSSPGTVAGGGTNWSQVTTNSYTSVIGVVAAIKTDGTLWTWGANFSGALGNNTTINRSSPGTTAGGGTNWKQVSAGGYYSTMTAIKTDGTLWTWGNNITGQLGDGTTTTRSSPGTTAGGGTNWSQVSVGQIIPNVAAIKTDGTLWTWGYNQTYGGLGDGTTIDRSSPGTVAGGGTNWSQVSSGGYCMAAIKTDGTLWTWGSNVTGQLGDNTTINRSSPGTVAGGGTNWSRVGAAQFSDMGNMAALKTDGTLWTWGSNISGQLGDGTTIDRSSPGTVAGGGTNWSQISVGIATTAAIQTS